MPLTPGRTYVYAGDVNMYWAPLGTKLPGWDVAFNAPWPSGWSAIYDTTGAIAIRPRNPREEVLGEFHDRLGSIRAGGGGGGRGGGGGGGGGRGGGGGAGGGPGVSIAFEVLTAEYNFWRNMNSFSKTVVAAVAAQRTLTITSGATASGSLSIVLNGGTPVVIPVLATDTTPAQIATKIAAGTFTGWSAAASGAVVTFTAAAVGLKTGAFSLSPAATGVVGTFGVVQPGHWGLTTSYVDSDAQHHIMFGCEFIPQAGSAQSGFWTEEHLMRAFGMECENVGQPEDIWGRSGRASVLTPNVQLECIPGTIDPTLLTGTGMENSADPEGRFFYADTPLTLPA